MLITVFTDAGFCPKTHIATWAVWAKCDGKTLRSSGVFKQDVCISDIAEVKAIINGLFKAIKTIEPAPRSKFIVQTDSKTAIKALTTGMSNKARKRKEFGSLKTVFEDLTKNFEIEFKWVQSHQGTVTPRNAVNSWCDSECTRLLNNARKVKQPELKLTVV